MLLLAAGKGEHDASCAEEHEGEHGEHDEDREALRLSDRAALVRQAGGTRDGERKGHEGQKRGREGHTMIVRIFLMR